MFNRIRFSPVASFNVNQLTGTMRALVVDNQGRISKLIDNLAATANNLNKTMQTISQITAAVQPARTARRRSKATTARTPRSAKPGSTQTPDATAQGKPKPAAKSAGNRRKGTP